MKILKNLAFDSDFFNRYVSLIKDTGKIKTVTQIISAITGIAVWYALSHNNLTAFLGWWACIPAGIFAVITAVAIEIGLRRYLPYGIRAFLYKRFEGPDLSMTIFIVPICLALLGATGYTSFKGSTNVVETFAPAVELQSTIAIDSTYSAKVAINKQTFLSDSLTIATTFNNQIDATKIKYAAKVTTAMNKAARFEKRAKKATRDKAYLLVLSGREETKADNYLAIQDSIIADLETAKGTKLLTLLNNRRTDKIGVDTTHQASTYKIVAANDKATSESKALIDTYGIGLGWITVVCLVIFIFLTIIEEIHKKGSDITEKVVYSQYDVLESVWSRWLNYVEELCLGALHRKLDKWESNLQNPSKPKPLETIYFIDDDSQKKIEIKPNNPTKQKRDLGQLFGANNIEDTSYSKNLSDDKIISATLPFNNTYSEEATVRVHNVLDDLSSEDKKGQSSDAPTINRREVKTVVNTVVVGQIVGEKECLNCGEIFQYKNKKKMYCSTNCRQDFWERTNGKKLKKGRVRK